MEHLSQHLEYRSKAIMERHILTLEGYRKLTGLLESRRTLLEKQWKAKSVREAFNRRKSLSSSILLLVLGILLAFTAGLSILGAILFKAETGHLPGGSHVAAFLIAAAVLICTAMYVARAFVWKRVILPLGRISETAVNYAGDKSDGTIDDFFFSHLKLETGDEIEELAAILAGMEQDIADSEQQLLRVTAEKERIVTELSIARDIQRDMLPGLFPPFPNRVEFDLYATMDPAKEVGGDFYDFMMVDDSHLAMIMADVSGKGIPAALFMMSSMIIIENYTSMGYSPSEVLSRSNEALCSMKLADMFVTVWLGILDLSTGIVTAANGGHECPAIQKHGGEFTLLKDRHDFVVGGMEGIPYHEYSFTLEPGDALFLYTDGVPEASNNAEELYGTGRMLDALNRCRNATPEDILPEVRRDIDSFVADAPQFDDLTMMCVRYLQPQA